MDVNDWNEDENGGSVFHNLAGEFNRAEGAFRTDRITYRVRDEYENQGRRLGLFGLSEVGGREPIRVLKKIGL